MLINWIIKPSSIFPPPPGFPANPFARLADHYYYYYYRTRIEITPSTQRATVLHSQSVARTQLSVLPSSDPRQSTNYSFPSSYTTSDATRRWWWRQEGRAIVRTVHPFHYPIRPTTTHPPTTPLRFIAFPLASSSSYHSRSLSFRVILQPHSIFHEQSQCAYPFTDIYSCSVCSSNDSFYRVPFRRCLTASVYRISK